MAEFIIAFRNTIENEGGYTNDPDDPGGETYKGIARKIHSKWDGWITIDLLKRQPGFPANIERDAEIRERVGEFYLANFWNKIQGDDIQSQEIAGSIFDFAVNAGTGTSVALAQMVVGAKVDGVSGNETVNKINAFNVDHFLAAFIVAKIARYVNIVKKRPTSRKYFYGWVIRALGENS
jgi:lysozyme family protein